MRAILGCPSLVLISVRDLPSNVILMPRYLKLNTWVSGVLFRVMLHVGLSAFFDTTIDADNRSVDNTYNAGIISEDLCTGQHFIALLKKPEGTECREHRTISLMSHISNILLGIIMLRARNIVRPEISEELSL